ncbi:MAG: hypothetical protein RSA84_24680 [Acinetobacter sp.]
MTTSTNSQEVINFGKHKGTALIDLDRAYVRWLLKLENLNGDLRKSLEALPWVQEELGREQAFQQRKAMAVRLQRSLTRAYPKSYKRAKGSLFWA